MRHFSICNYVRFIWSMASMICLMFLFVVLITCENGFAHLHLMPILPSVLLGVFANVINVVMGGVSTTHAIGMSKRFTKLKGHVEDCH